MSVAVATAKSDESGVYEREDLLNGCQAVAQGVCLADVDVIAAYPIRPYTEVMDAISKLIADGKFDAEYIIADSEHSQFEIVKHASSVNARAFGGSSGTAISPPSQSGTVGRDWPTSRVAGQASSRPSASRPSERYDTTESEPGTAEADAASSAARRSVCRSARRVVTTSTTTSPQPRRK